MKEELVSFETAKLLKEKGFSLSYPSACYYNNELWISENLIAHSDIKKPDGNYLFKAPTQSLAQKWLREKHNIQVYANSATLKNGKYADYVAFVNGLAINDPRDEEYQTCEEALEEGLKQGLLLIK